MPLGINAVPEEYRRRQTDYVSALPGVTVVVDDHLVFVCGNTMAVVCKDHK